MDACGTALFRGLKRDLGITTGMLDKMKYVQGHKIGPIECLGLGNIWNPHFFRPFHAAMYNLILIPSSAQHPHSG